MIQFTALCGIRHALHYNHLEHMQVTCFVHLFITCLNIQRFELVQMMLFCIVISNSLRSIMRTAILFFCISVFCSLQFVVQNWILIKANCRGPWICSLNSKENLNHQKTFPKSWSKNCAIDLEARLISFISR